MKINYIIFCFNFMYINVYDINESNTVSKLQLSFTAIY